jgi:hypothetical protein
MFERPPLSEAICGETASHERVWRTSPGCPCRSEALRMVLDNIACPRTMSTRFCPYRVRTNRRGATVVLPSEASQQHAVPPAGAEAGALLRVIFPVLYGLACTLRVAKRERIVNAPQGAARTMGKDPIRGHSRRLETQMAGLRATLLEGFEARLTSGPTLDLPTKKAKALPGPTSALDSVGAIRRGDPRRSHPGGRYDGRR